MFLAGTFFNAGSRAEQNDLAEVTHLLEEFFESAMIGDGLCEKASLCLGQRRGGSLSLNFSS